MHRALALGALVLLAGWVTPLGAQTRTADEGPRHVDPDRPAEVLDLATARRLALTENPAYLAALQRLAAARGDLTGARTYAFNPEATAEGPSSLSSGDVGRYEVRLGQELEWAGQRGLRVDAAEAGVRAAGGDILDAARLLLADVEGAYYRLAAAEERMVVARTIATLNDRLLDAVGIQLSEGEVSVLEVNLVDIEAARARARVLEVDRALQSARLEFNRLVGLAPDSAIRVDPESLSAPPVPDPDSVGDPSTLMDARPDLRAARGAETQALVLRRLAGREALPNLRIEGIAERETAGVEPRFGIGVSIPIPLFDRNQGTRARREAEAAAAELRTADVERRIRTEILDARFAYRTSTRELEIYRYSVLEAARRNRVLLDAAYREGKLDLTALLLLRNQLLDAELAYWDTWERQRLAAVALRSATAAILDSTNLLPEDLR